MRTIKLLLLLSVLFYAGAWYLNDKVVINPTESLPRGIYVRTEQLTPMRGDIALVCVPDNDVGRLFVSRGYVGTRECQNGVGRILKTVAGLPRDRFRITETGIEINGQILEDSNPKVFDSAGRSMPTLSFEGVLGGSEYLFLGKHPDSLDSRYLGPIQGGQIMFIVRPILLID